MTVKKILGIIPGLQATSLVAHNMKLAKFKMKPTKKMDVKKPIKKLIGAGAMTLVGIGLIKPTSKLINNL